MFGHVWEREEETGKAGKLEVRPSFTMAKESDCCPSPISTCSGKRGGPLITAPKCPTILHNAYYVYNETWPCLDRRWQRLDAGFCHREGQVEPSMPLVPSQILR